MKYKVGDIVKLRDDLEVDKFYKGIKFIYEMERLKHLPIELLKHETFDKCYKVEDYNGKDYIVSEAMIEGLWEENKPKLKLIDILNKIANGELKEGTKVIWNNTVFEYIKNINGNFDIIFASDVSKSNNIFEFAFMENLNDEVELIEPEQFREDTKMIGPTDNAKTCKHEWAEYETYNSKTGEIRHYKECVECGLQEAIEDNTTQKIEELDKDSCGVRYEYNSQGEVYARGFSLEAFKEEIIDKLNEVIRYINK